MLLLHANEVVSADRLLDALWPEGPPPSGSAALQVRVSHLRKALGPAGRLVVTRPAGYAIEVGRSELDVYRFEELVGAADGAEPEEAAATLRGALDLWRGPALADVAYEEFAQPAIARLEELRLAALERRIEADLALGRHVEVVGELEALVGCIRCGSAVRGQLMLALYRSGRQAEALACFQTARAGRSSTTSVSSRGRRCVSSSSPFCGRIRASTSPEPRHRSGRFSPLRSSSAGSTRCSP